MRLELIMPRPKYHFTSKGKLKDTAPYWHTVKPDTTKMLRAAEDALKDILWHDDGQVALQSNGKRYGNQPGAQITVMNLIHPMTKEDHE
jgi:Holliday junction resolvase RusA-like endonuclease